VRASQVQPDHFSHPNLKLFSMQHVLYFYLFILQFDDGNLASCRPEYFWSPMTMLQDVVFFLTLHNGADDSFKSTSTLGVCCYRGDGHLFALRKTVGFL
jgi:hypothetical protein